MAERMPGENFQDSIPLKRAKLESSPSVISEKEMESFSTKYKAKYSKLKQAFNLLLFGKRSTSDLEMTSAYVLVPLEIEWCNGKYDVCFNKVDMHVLEYNYGLRFGHIFEPGIKILFDFFNLNKAPDDEEDRETLKKLITFFVRDHDSELKNYQEPSEEAETCLFLMNHLITPLSSCESWKIDRSFSYKQTHTCPCFSSSCPRRHTAADLYEDLSFGNVLVWHGAVDAMTLNNVPVVVLGDHNARDPETLIEAKAKSVTLAEEISQLYAETIVFSFLQRKSRADLNFVPMIGIKEDAIIVVMYDCTLDVLLATKEIELNKEPPEASYVMFLMIWLTCNYLKFSTPLAASIKADLSTRRAHFFDFAGEKLPVYQKLLRFQRVRRKGNVQRLVPPRCEDIKDMEGSYTFVPI